MGTSDRLDNARERGEGRAKEACGAATDDEEKRAEVRRSRARAT